LDELLKKLYEYHGDEDLEGNVSASMDHAARYRQPRGVLLITDRTIDMVSPLRHDFSYWSSSFDLLADHQSELNEILE